VSGLDVDGLLLDIDGVLAVAWTPLAGAPETLRLLRDRGVPFRLVTNTTTHSRVRLAATLQEAGFEVRPEELITAAAATSAYLRVHHPGARCFLVAKGDTPDDMEGVELVREGADVVVIGGAEEEFTYENMNRAFRMLMDGAALVAMHRNLYWMTDEGLKVDAGVYVRGLEEAAGVGAEVVGKPQPGMFEAGLLELGGLPADRVAMVGDDVIADVLAAQALGITGILVRTGKYRPENLSRAPVPPDHVIDSIADLPSLLDLS
jgi:HAD superfamily hydrolase (TIGR01458 family)